MSSQPSLASSRSDFDYEPFVAADRAAAYLGVTRRTLLLKARRQEERVEIQTLGARPASLLFGKLLPAAHLSHRKRRCEWPGIKTAR